MEKGTHAHQDGKPGGEARPKPGPYEGDKMRGEGERTEQLAA